MPGPRSWSKWINQRARWHGEPPRLGLLDHEVAARLERHFLFERAPDFLLDAMQVEHHLVEADGEAGKVTGLIEAAYEKSAPVGIVIGGEPRP